jgi:streptogramin lyase
MAFAAGVINGCKCSDPPEVKPRWETGTETDGGSDGGGTPGQDAGGPTFDPDAGVTIPGRPDGGFLGDAGTGPLSGGDNVQVDPEGNIVLGGGQTELAFAWIANNDANTVSKYDTRTGKEVGRYHAVIPIDGRTKPDGTIGYPNGLRGNVGNNPSRTAVDLYGDVWVANRASSTQGSVTKIFNSKQFCTDRNGNGVIDTSEDRNGDGAISTNPADQEMIFPANWDDPAQYDECIAFSTPVGPPGNGTIKARAMAISAGLEGTPGDIWVGVHNENSVVKLDPFTGQQVPVNSAGQMRITLPFGPYGAAIDSQQRLWVVSSALTPARLALVDTVNGVLVRGDIIPGSPITSSGNYGIAVDGQDRVWLAGWSSGPKAFRYTHPRGVGPTLGTWAEFDFSNAVSQINTRLRRPRGIAADEQGFIWMSSDLNTSNASSSQLIAFNGDTGALRRFDYPGMGMVDFIDATDGRTREAIGVGLDTDGNAWVNNRSGNAIRISRDTGEILRTAQQGTGLYTYSDFTGYQLRNFTAPLGSFRQTFTSPCGPDTVWRYLVWDAVVPPRTSIQAFVTVSNNQSELTNPLLKKGPFTTSPADLQAAGVPKGTFIRVEFVLRSDDRQSQLSPKLRSFDVNYECDIIIQ